jgi:putative transposase
VYGFAPFGAESSKTSPRSDGEDEVMIHQAYRYELKPNNVQRTLLAKHVGAARYAWNWALARRIERFENNEGKDRFTNAIADHRSWNAWKRENAPWAAEVSKCAPQEAFRNLDRAFKNFWQGRKAGRAVGFPKFKKKGGGDSCRFYDTIKALGRHVQLPRLGKVRVKEETRVKGRILSATISRETDRWFVSFTVERERAVAEPRSEGPRVGIDLGISSFAVISDGTVLEAPRPMKHGLKRLRKLQRKHSRKRKGSKNRKKSAAKLGRYHRKLKNQRHDFLHKATTDLAKTKRVIVIEDLAVKNMSASARGTKENPGKNVRAKSGLNRSILDQGWGEFRRMLTYKAEWYGATLFVVPRTFCSSKMCSACKFVLSDLPLSIRKWRCPNCKVVHDRDVNAAQNLEDYPTASSAESYACGDSSDGRPAVRRSVSHESLKQEANCRPLPS